VYACIYVYVYVCMYVDMYVCLFMYVCMQAYVCIKLKMGPIGCPETSVRNYHYSLCNTLEESSSELF